MHRKVTPSRIVSLFMLLTLLITSVPVNSLAHASGRSYALPVQESGQNPGAAPVSGLAFGTEPDNAALVLISEASVVVETGEPQEDRHTTATESTATEDTNSPAPPTLAAEHPDSVARPSPDSLPGRDSDLPEILFPVLQGEAEADATELKPARSADALESPPTDAGSQPGAGLSAIAYVRLEPAEPLPTQQLPTPSASGNWNANEAFAARQPTRTWDGEAGDGLWQTPANWTGNTLPGATDDVSIPSSANVTLSSGTHSINSLQSGQAGHCRWLPLHRC